MSHTQPLDAALHHVMAGAAQVSTEFRLHCRTDKCDLTAFNQSPTVNMGDCFDLWHGSRLIFLCLITAVIVQSATLQQIAPPGAQGRHATTM